MTSTLRRARALLEESDVYENDLSTQLVHLNELRRLGTHKDRLVSMWTAQALADHAVGTSKEAQRLLEHATLPTGLTLTDFYTELGDAEENYIVTTRKPVDEMEIFLELGLSEEDEEDPIAWLNSKYTGEEMNGRYLDLVLWHMRWNNLEKADVDAESKHNSGDSHGNKLWRRKTYVEYAHDLPAFPGSLQFKMTPKYYEYLKGLLDYLVDFYARARPISDISGFQKKALDKFENEWRDGGRASWIAGDIEESTRIWCEPCQRFFAKESVYQGHVNSKAHKKKAAQHEEAIANGTWDAQASESARNEDMKNNEERIKKVASLEFLGKALLRGPLRSMAGDTITHAERRMAITDPDELQEANDLEAKEAAEEAAVMEQKKRMQKKKTEEDSLYNPLDLPIGWDGNPIPYWLYKVQGLGHKFPCEICSGFVYRGRRNFDRHFQESRHAFGLRALGIPNTKHFYGLTNIQDALDLAEKLRVQGRKRKLQTDTVEELEDAAGNVYSKKTYEDMKRQGLIE